MKVDMDAFTVEFTGPRELFELKYAIDMARHRLDEVTGQPAPIEDTETDMLYGFVVDVQHALFDVLSQP